MVEAADHLASHIVDNLERLDLESADFKGDLAEIIFEGINDFADDRYGGEYYGDYSREY